MSLRLKEVPVSAQAAEGSQGGMAKPTHPHSETQHCSERELLKRVRGSKEQQVWGETDLENRGGVMFVDEASQPTFEGRCWLLVGLCGCCGKRWRSRGYIPFVSTLT